MSRYTLNALICNALVLLVFQAAGRETDHRPEHPCVILTRHPNRTTRQNSGILMKTPAWG
jgi:hypothetical protein